LPTAASSRARGRVTGSLWPRGAVGALATLVLATLTLAFAPAAFAAKQPIDFFGGGLGTLGGQLGNDNIPIAVNDSGAGSADAGDVYLFDEIQNRIQRFGRDDGGTPGNTVAGTADDTYFFISAWGADVVKDGGTGDLGDAVAATYEICTVAAQCKAGVASGGNGAQSGNGSIANATGTETLSQGGAIAVDQDTGWVYVSDAGNRRVNVYEGDGVFLRSFGYDVVQAGAGAYEVCVAGDDVCRTGAPGAGVGAVGAKGGMGIAVSPPDGNPASGTVFLADPSNNRIDTYALDGSAPGTIGSVAVFDEGIYDPARVTVDSRGVVYAVSLNQGAQDVERYDSENANGGGVDFLSPIPAGVSEVQMVLTEATAGTFRLSFDPDGAGPKPVETTVDLPYDARGRHEAGSPVTPEIDTVKEALEALPSLQNHVEVSQQAEGPVLRSYRIVFLRALAAADVPQLIVSNGSPPLSGGAGASVVTLTSGQDGLIGTSETDLAIDPDADGAGPDTDVLYALRGNGVVQQFGPSSPPGLTVPPSADEVRHGTNRVYRGEGLAMESATGRIYVTGINDGISDGLGRRVFVLDDSGPAPTATLDSCPQAEVSETSISCHATIDPNGPPVTRYRFEYVDDAAYQQGGFAEARSTPETIVGSQEDPQAVQETIEAPGVGLEPNTSYHVRLIAGRRFTTPVTTAELTATTNPASPIVETTGTMVRGATTAQLNGRVNPRNSATTYRFEYGAQGSCSSNPCVTTATRAAGAAGSEKLVAENVSGLGPATTYHYRVVAAGGGSSPVYGDDMTITTRVADTPLSHDDAFPGPPESDRSWEMVSLADSAGVPVNGGKAFSDDGGRALYGLSGGSSISNSGSTFDFYNAEREEGQPHQGSWQTSVITPLRNQLQGNSWSPVDGADDLSSIFSIRGGAGTTPALWRMSPQATAAKVFEPTSPQQFSTGYWGADPGGTHAVVRVSGGAALDPDYPEAASRANLYILSPGQAPELASLLPGNKVSACPIDRANGTGQRSTNWLSAGGTRLLFVARDDESCDSSGPRQLYLRDTSAQTTTLISGPSLSGRPCEAALVRATATFVFFWTQARLATEDTEPFGCNENGTGSDGDVYRYRIASGVLDCVTCVATVNADIQSSISGESGLSAPAVVASSDGARLYFVSSARLLAVAPSKAQVVYRIDVGSGELAYVGPGPNGSLTSVPVSDDGSLLLFASSNATLNPLGGPTNGGTSQLYLYRDDDRSLSCVSCPQDGSPPLGAAISTSGVGTSMNTDSLAENGTVIFTTPVALSPADQNTPGGGSAAAGADAYEWRDGRQILLSDGMTNWPSGTEPVVSGIDRSGHNAFFIAYAQYTADAFDAFGRLYNARIGGGFEFPPPPRPCPLEVCQGVPRGAPDEAQPGTLSFGGYGNARQLGSCAQESRAAKRLTRSAKQLRRRAKNLARMADRLPEPRRNAIDRRVHRLTGAAEDREAAARDHRAVLKRCPSASSKRKAAR